MTNLEKYLDDIIDILFRALSKEKMPENLNDYESCKLHELVTGNATCDSVSCDECRVLSREWLNKKYEPPLLKNADNLNIGDWVMVRDCEGGCWVKRRFIFFKDGYFYVTFYAQELPSNKTLTVTGYSQARLPNREE